MPTQILVFGDSIAYGMMDAEAGGWVQRLRKYVDGKMIRDSDFYCTVYNLGVSGDLTEDVIRRFGFSAKQRLKKPKPAIIIFAIGANDAQFLSTKNGMRVPRKKFRRNIQKLIGLARRFTQKVMFVGVTPVDESKTNPIPWDTIKYYKNGNLREYDGIIKAVCAKSKIPFVDVFDMGPDAIFVDGLHPNSRGHRIIFGRVREALAKNGWLG